MANTAFIALYRGRTIGDARLIAVSSDHSIVERFFRELAGENDGMENHPEMGCRDARPTLALARHED